ncbi:MAG: metallophosphoesterase [Lachnospiraceae bacterium]|jgi:putative phosphoesterase|nr:metallophosphoesterase [Lachnospiraceae bacterium]MCI9676129.1 metallophosphoesterase [Lachnospiraceae bacterium]
MKILLVSDTHKKNENYFIVLEEVKPDLVIHCGDGEGSEYALTQAADCPVEIVLGNNDFFSDLPRERVLELEGYKVWVTHGHNYYVSMGRETIKREAAARGMDIVCFGHTHRPVVDVEDTVTALNPGSLSYPRQDGKRPSYMIMNLKQGIKADYKIHYL